VRQYGVGARFDPALLALPRGGTTKCFEAVPPTKYVDYMRRHLQPKRIGFTEKYIHGDTNKKRNKDEECIWKDDSLQTQLREVLNSLPYYQFCQTCLGSKDDLLAANHK
jgi:hypothetical protein